VVGKSCARRGTPAKSKEVRTRRILGVKNMSPQIPEEYKNRKAEIFTL
jgi:hypothetical protein